MITRTAGTTRAPLHRRLQHPGPLPADAASRRRGRGRGAAAACLCRFVTPDPHEILLFPGSGIVRTSNLRTRADHDHRIRMPCEFLIGILKTGVLSMTQIPPSVGSRLSASGSRCYGRRRITVGRHGSTKTTELVPSVDTLLPGERTGLWRIRRSRYSPPPGRMWQSCIHCGRPGGVALR